jgi:hypothetical protein
MPSARAPPPARHSAATSSGQAKRPLCPLRSPLPLCRRPAPRGPHVSRSEPFPRSAKPIKHVQIDCPDWPGHLSFSASCCLSRPELSEFGDFRVSDHRLLLADAPPSAGSVSQATTRAISEPTDGSFRPSSSSEPRSTGAASAALVGRFEGLHRGNPGGESTPAPVEVQLAQGSMAGGTAFGRGHRWNQSARHLAAPTSGSRGL